MKNDKKLPNTWGNRDSWDNITFFSYMEDLEEESKKLRENGASVSYCIIKFLNSMQSNFSYEIRYV